jgi:hypothetical protein
VPEECNAAFCDEAIKILNEHAASAATDAVINHSDLFATLADLFHVDLAKAYPGSAAELSLPMLRSQSAWCWPICFTMTCVFKSLSVDRLTTHVISLLDSWR